jgi:hypothetical protein
VYDGANIFGSVKWPVKTMAETRGRPAAARAGAGASAGTRAGTDADAGAAADGGGAVGLRQVEAEVLPDGTLKRSEAAKFLGHNPQTLARWAVRGEGPPYFRLGKFVFYRLADLKAYKAKHAVERLPKQPDLL